MNETNQQIKETPAKLFLLPSQILVNTAQAIRLAQYGMDWPTDHHYKQETGDMPQEGSAEVSPSAVPAPRLLDAIEWLNQAAGVHIETRYSQILKKHLLAMHAGGQWLGIPKFAVQSSDRLAVLSAGLDIALGLAKINSQENEEIDETDSTE